MRRRMNGQRGLSLVEATIILMVLSVLTAVVAPSIGDYVDEAKNTKAKEDVEAIGTAIVRLTRDIGQPCLQKAAGACSKANRVDLLFSAGNDPGIDTSAGFAVTFTFPAGTGQDAGAINWKAIGATAPTETDTPDNQFVTNNPAYAGPSYTAGGGPKAGLGWRGSYLSGPIGQDPWGNRYEASTAFLTVATDASAGSTEGLLSGGWASDVIVISAGSNGVLQTPYGSAGGNAKGDDVTYVVSGTTR